MGDIDYTAFDPELRSRARVLPKGYALHRSLALPRALMGLAGRFGRMRGVEVASIDDNVAPGVSVRIHRPAGLSGPGPAMLWIHGGGMVMGCAAQEDAFCRKLADSTKVTVAAVDHRLAPEHPYPTPLEDCYAALRWLARQPWVDSTRIAIGGASAGGGFSAAAAQLARDRGDVKLRLQMLVYPMLDDRTGANGDRGRVMWSASDNQLAWQWYLAGADPMRAVPARRADLSGLPPAWIGVGTQDPFHEECREYAARLREAGVPVHEEIAAGAFHAFDLIAANASVSKRFFASQCRAVRAALVDEHAHD